MLNNIGGYSVDKAKFAIECIGAEAMEREREFIDAVANTVGPQGGRSYNVVSVKKGVVPGTYLYIFDVWGEAAQDIDGLDFLTWYKYVDRIDLKLPMAMTSDGQRNYYDLAREILHGKRNIDLKESPIRQKRGNRDAGGYTLAIGSHKSDFRVHWTLRGDEDGYQEFQLEGSRISAKQSVTQYYLSHPGENDARVSWEGFMRSLLTSAQVELTDLDGLYDSERAEIFAGSTDAHGVVERKLERIESDIAHLPKDALFALLDTLNERIFGTPPETKEFYQDDQHSAEDEE